MEDLRELARFDDRVSYLYIENARIEQQDMAVAVHDKSGMTAVPVASLAVLMLGPGTSITHAAIHRLAENNCLVAWVGQEGVRLYAHSTGGTRSSANLIRQARLWSRTATRLDVVNRMYRRRFEQALPTDLTLQQLRGHEGIRVREAYAHASAKWKVPWSGRNYVRGDWSAADPVNRAISTANACLYGVVHAAILSAGYSAALGFIHTGKQLSFVYDIADLYKADVVIPIAFEVAGTVLTALEKSVRLACRDRFRELALVERIIPDIHWVLDVRPRDDDEEPPDAYESDPAKPSPLWDPKDSAGRGDTEGGVNYGGSDR